MENIFDDKLYSLIKALISVLFLAVICIVMGKKIKTFLFHRNKFFSSPCLKLLENFMLDSKRRLVRIQNSDQEYLILLSPSGDIVISSSKLQIPPSAAEIDQI